MALLSSIRGIYFSKSLFGKVSTRRRYSMTVLHRRSVAAGWINPYKVTWGQVSWTQLHSKDITDSLGIADTA